MSYELTGKLIHKGETEQVSERFKKREFVLEKEEKNGTMVFQDFVKFQAVQDKCDILDPFQEGQELKVSFNLRGRKWEKNGQVSYFTNLDAWRIEPLGGGDSGSGPRDVPPPTDDDDIFGADDEDEVLPF